jgi:type IV pilus assembly protein PilA
MRQKRAYLPRPRRSSRGFTFIELLQVAAIVGILFAIAVPAYNNYLKRARVAEALAQLGDARVAVNDFFGRWGYLPADNAQAGLLPADEIKGKYLRRLEVTNGALRAQIDMGHDADKKPVLQTLSLRPLINTAQPTAPIVWLCGIGDLKARFPNFTVNGEAPSDPVEDRFLPSTCRS